MCFQKLFLLKTGPYVPTRFIRNPYICDFIVVHPKKVFGIWHLLWKGKTPNLNDFKWKESNEDAEKLVSNYLLNQKEIHNHNHNAESECSK